MRIEKGKRELLVDEKKFFLNLFYQRLIHFYGHDFFLLNSSRKMRTLSKVVQIGRLKLSPKRNSRR